MAQYSKIRKEEIREKEKINIKNGCLHLGFKFEFNHITTDIRVC